MIVVYYITHNPFFSHQEEQLDIVSLGSSVEEEDSPLVFLQKVHSLRERVEAFIEAPLPSILNLSISPRAAEHLQRHWHPLTVGSLDEAPIPKVCCCARCGSQEAHAATEAGRDRADRRVMDPRSELQPAAAATVVLLGLLALLAALWFSPVGGASLGFSALSGFGQAVHGLSGELVSCVSETAGEAYAVMEEAVQRWSSQLSSAGQNVFQQLAALFQTSTSR